VVSYTFSEEIIYTLTDNKRKITGVILGVVLA